MRFFFLFCILSGFFECSAQKVYFTDSTNLWKYSNPGSSVQPFFGGHQQAYTGKVSIGGKSYLILPSFHPQSFSPTYIREDTLLKKVFIRFDTLPGVDGIKPDTFEHVLYDYNLKVGDTFRFSPDNGSTKFVHIVASIDSVMVGGIFYKVWTLHNDPNSGMQSVPYTVIEGIGCTTDVLFPIFPLYFEFNSFLFCFENQGRRPAIVPPKTQYLYFYYEYPWGVKLGVGDFDNTNSCYFLTSVREMASQVGLYTYPQPATERFTVEFPKNIINGEIRLRDFLGKIVFHNLIDNRDRVIVPVSNLSPGLFLLEVIDQGTETIYRKKVMIQ